VQSADLIHSRAMNELQLVHHSAANQACERVELQAWQLRNVQATSTWGEEVLSRLCLTFACATKPQFCDRGNEQWIHQLPDCSESSRMEGMNKKLVLDAACANRESRILATSTSTVARTRNDCPSTSHSPQDACFIEHCSLAHCHNMLHSTFDNLTGYPCLHEQAGER
jgi:hypothetical protein